MDPSARLRLEVITPGGVVYRDAVDFAEAPGVLGYFGVLPGHAPFLSQIVDGRLRVVQGDKEVLIAVHWGFVEVLDDEVIVLAETAEVSGDIDLERAETALKRARERLAEFGAAYDVERARRAVKRAETRLEVAHNEAGSGEARDPATRSA